MSSADASTSKKDWAWNHCSLPEPDDKNKVKCDYCDHVSNGGINRFKRHLAGVRGSVRSCKKVPKAVQERVSRSLDEIKEKKAGKAKVLESRGTLRPRDEEDDHDMNEMRGSSSGGLKRQKGPVDKSLGSPLEVAGVARQSTSRQTTSKDFNMQHTLEVSFSTFCWLSEAVKLKSFDVMCETRRLYDSEFRKPTVYELCGLLVRKNAEMAGREHNCSSSEKVSEALEHALEKIAPVKIGGSERETCQVLHNQQDSHIMHPVVLDTLEQHLNLGGGTTCAGYNGCQVNIFSSHPQHVSFATDVPLENTSIVPHYQLISSAEQTPTTKDDSTGLEFAPLQESMDFQPNGQSNCNTDGDWSRQWDSHPSYLEQIRMESYETLGFSKGGTYFNLQEDGHRIPSYSPSPPPIFDVDEDFNWSFGKAVVGWLKVKAAMRWGIFIRKKAAERRAQLVELED